MAVELSTGEAPLVRTCRDAAGVHLGTDGPFNPGLLFQRYLPCVNRIGKDKKQKELQGICAASEQTDPALLAAWNERWRAMAGAACATIFERATEAPLLIGFGNKGAFEIGFTFHFLGFPYLPGSGVKGLARAWAFFKVIEAAGNFDLEELPEDAVAGRLREIESQLTEPDLEKYTLSVAGWPEQARALAGQFRLIFGHQNDAGHAIFFDAIPRDDRKGVKMVMDILNPHYPEYGNGTSLPTNWQDPPPVQFLTVAAHTVFCFAVGWRGLQPPDERDLAARWLQESLAFMGAGSKTSAGYGFFKTEPPAPQRERKGPYLDETVTGSIYDDSDPQDYWVWLDGYSNQQNQLLARMPRTPGIPALVENQIIRACVVHVQGRKGADMEVILRWEANQ